MISKPRATASRMLLAVIMIGGVLSGAGAPVNASAGWRAPVRTVDRAYGDGPVRTRSAGESVNIRFRAQRGDLVRLRIPGWLPDCVRTSLWRHDRRLDPQASGYWRAKEPGFHEFRFRSCDRLRAGRELQLVKLVVRTARPDGAEVNFPRRRGYEYAADVTVPAEGVLLQPRVRQFYRAFRSIAPRNGPPRTLWFGRFVVLLPGSQVFAGGAELPRPDLAVRTGSRFRVFVKDAVALRVGRPSVTEAVVDGDPIQLAEGAEPGFREIRFTGTAGQWVYPAYTPLQSRLTHLLVGPDHHLVPLTAIGQTSGGLYHLSGSGAHRLLVIGPPAAASVRLRTALELPAMPLDGTKTVFAPSTPGQVVVAPFVMPEQVSYRFAASDSTLTGSWLASAHTLDYPHCPPRGPQGCGEWAGAIVTPSNPEAGPISRSGGAGERWVTVLWPPPDSTGQLQLSITPGFW